MPPPSAMDLTPPPSFSDLSPLWEEVARRAYRRWKGRGCEPGGELCDWLAAERELDLVLAGLKPTDSLDSLQELFAHHQRQHDYREAEYAVTRLLANALTLGAAANRILQAVCVGLGWEAGLLWIVDRQAERLYCVDAWQAPGLNLTAFLGDHTARSFPRAIGLVGNVWDRDAAIWLNENLLTSEWASLPRAAIARFHTAAAFPIRNGTELLGVIELFASQPRLPLEAVTQSMASIGSQISQFIERRGAEVSLRRAEAERRAAGRIQQGLLPKVMPLVPPFHIHGKTIAASEVGGDFFDFLPMHGDGEQAVGVTVGDASGHGLGAALLIAETRAYIRALSLTCSDLGMILAHTNDYLCERSPEDHFVTLQLVRLCPRRRSLVHVGAGHCSGFLLGREGQIKETLRSTAPPLAVRGQIDAPMSAEIALASGDLIFLYTDGVIEAHGNNRALFGIERALDIVRRNLQERAEVITNRLCQAAQEHCGGQAPHDDMSVVVVKVD